MVKANAKVPLDGSITTNGLFLEQTYPASGMFSISKEEHPNQYDAEPDESHGDDFIIGRQGRIQEFPGGGKFRIQIYQTLTILELFRALVCLWIYLSMFL